MHKVAKRRTNLALRPLRGLALVRRPALELALALSGNNNNSSLLRAPALALDSVHMVSPVAQAHLVSPLVSRTPLEAQAPDLDNNPRVVRSGNLLRVLLVVSAVQLSARTPAPRRLDNQPKLRVHSAPRLGHLDSRNHLVSAASAALPLARGARGPALGHSGRISNSRSKIVLSGSPRLDLERLDKAVSSY